MTRVALLRTAPGSVLDDYRRLMKLARYEGFLPRDAETLLKLNLSWTRYFPACSTAPWQLEGVLRTLLEDGYAPERLLAVENRTVVTEPRPGARNNRWLGVLERWGVRFQPLDEVDWVPFQSRTPLLKLASLFPGGIEVPRLWPGKYVLHLPTVKTHGHAMTTGAVKNAFGGLLREVRHYGHEFIHEVLVDLLIMQRELNPGVFAVMDGTVCGDGAGPRTMQPVAGNVILAGADPVAVDAVAARLMGFDPFAIPYLRMAHDRGLGVADLARIELVGDDVRDLGRTFTVRRSFVIWGDQMLRRGFLRPLKHIALHSPLRVWAPLASNLYHDILWYPLVGRARVARFRTTGWGRLLDRDYPNRALPSSRS